MLVIRRVASKYGTTSECRTKGLAERLRRVTKRGDARVPWCSGFLVAGVIRLLWGCPHCASTTPSHSGMFVHVSVALEWLRPNTGPTFYYSFLSGSVLSRHLLLLQRGGATRGESAMNLARIECEVYW